MRDGYKTLPPEWRPQVSFPVIPGTDISGMVEIADDAGDFSIGDEVYSMVDFPPVLTAIVRPTPNTLVCQRQTSR